MSDTIIELDTTKSSHGPFGISAPEGYDNKVVLDLYINPKRVTDWASGRDLVCNDLTIEQATALRDGLTAAIASAEGDTITSTVHDSAGVWVRTGEVRPPRRGEVYEFPPVETQRCYGDHPEGSTHPILRRIDR